MNVKICGSNELEIRKKVHCLAQNGDFCVSNATVEFVICTLLATNMEAEDSV